MAFSKWHHIYFQNLCKVRTCQLLCSSFYIRTNLTLKILEEIIINRCISLFFVLITKFWKQNNFIKKDNHLAHRFGGWKSKQMVQALVRASHLLNYPVVNGRGRSPCTRRDHISKQEARETRGNQTQTFITTQSWDLTRLPQETP
jgi:hypothetical protein